MWNKLVAMVSFLKEGSEYSTMRVATFFIIVAFIPAFVMIWYHVSLVAGELADIPASVNWIIGIVLGAKTTQKLVEVIGNAIDKKVVQPGEDVK